MSDHTPNEQFVRSLTEHQSRLYVYILAIAANHEIAGDVFQNTNVAIWQNAAKYTEGTDFWAWISRIAQYQILAYRKRCQRDRLVFDDELLADVAEDASHHVEAIVGDLAALDRCVKKLPSPDRELIRARYRPGASVKELAQLRGKSAGAISQALYRIRAQLADCIEEERVGCTEDERRVGP